MYPVRGRKGQRTARAGESASPHHQEKVLCAQDLPSAKTIIRNTNRLFSLFPSIDVLAFSKEHLNDAGSAEAARVNVPGFPQAAAHPLRSVLR